VRSRKELAEAAAIASFLIVLAVILVLWGRIDVRLAVATLIAAPAGVMLGYYIVDKGARDRLYSIGLYSTIIVVAFIIGGLEARIVVAAFLSLVAALIILSVLGRS